MLYLQCYFLNKKSVYPQFKVTFPFVDVVVEQMATLEDYFQEPSLAIHYQVIKMHQDMGNKQHYFDLKKLMRKDLKKLSKQDAKNIFAYARNYLDLKNYQGYYDYDYNGDFLHLIDWEVEEKLLDLLPKTFCNIVNTAIDKNGLQWAEEFIQKHTEKADPQYRAETCRCNFVLLAFYEKDYEGVLEFLLDQKKKMKDFSDDYYKTYARITLLKTYYELGDDYFEEFYMMWNNLNMDLTKKRLGLKINADIVHNLIVFLRIIKRLHKLTSNLNKEKRAKQIAVIEEKIKKVKHPTYKAWLSDKVEEEKNRN